MGHAACNILLHEGRRCGRLIIGGGKEGGGSGEEKGAGEALRADVCVIRLQVCEHVAVRVCALGGRAVHA